MIAHGNNRRIGGLLVVATWLGLASGIVAVSPMSAFAQRSANGAGKPKDLETIVQARQKQARMLKSLEMQYDVNSEALVDVGDVKRYLRMEFLVTEKKWFAFKGDKRYSRFVRPAKVLPMAPDVEIDWDSVPNGREMKEAIDAQGAGKTVIRDEIEQIPELEVAYDGQFFRRYVANGISGKATAESRHAEIVASGFRQQYFNSILMALPEIGSVQADDSIELDLVNAIGRGRYRLETATDNVDGAECVILNRSNTEKVWLDPALEYSVRRRETYDPDSGLLQQRFVNRDFKKFKPGVWLPQTFWVEYCGPPKAPAAFAGKPLVRYVNTVKELSVNKVSDSLFVLQFEAGTPIADGTVMPLDDSGKRPVVIYEMPADPKQLALVIEKAVARLEHRQSFWGRYGGVVFWTINIIVICIFIAIIIFKYRQSISAIIGRRSMNQ